MYKPATSALRPGADAIICSYTFPLGKRTPREGNGEHEGTRRSRRAQKRERESREHRPEGGTPVGRRGASGKGNREGKRDHGMTYIWPTGRRVELLIQFALKHSLRFISFRPSPRPSSLLLPFRDYRSSPRSPFHPCSSSFRFTYRIALLSGPLKAAVAVDASSDE